MRDPANPFPVGRQSLLAGVGKLALTARLRVGPVAQTARLCVARLRVAHRVFGFVHLEELPKAVTAKSAPLAASAPRQTPRNAVIGSCAPKEPRCRQRARRSATGLARGVRRVRSLPEPMHRFAAPGRTASLAPMYIPPEARSRIVCVRSVPMANSARRSTPVRAHPPGSVQRGAFRRRRPRKPLVQFVTIVHQGLTAQEESLLRSSATT
jgi:hypothetical protein